MLPTPAQWDTAAGLYRRGGRITSGDGDEIAIGRANAVPVGTMSSDITPEGIHDMAGNGREFTRQIWTPPDQPIRLMPVPPDTDGLIILRGRMFTLARPLSHADLLAEQDQPQSQDLQQPSWYTSFRAVIELPS